MSDLLEQLRSSVDDRYRVHGEVGRGGMAVVFNATDTRHHRTVAIKVLRPELAPLIGGERFLREISVAANLAHPNILPLHDSNEVDGLVYYVMPFIEGESLAERLARDGPLPVAQAVSLTRQLASALHYAHEHGVVHRDLKPANVLLSGGQPLLADFGIARAIGDTQAQAMTATGVALGTPAYMSPEQWSADVDIDGRSDIYSLGCLLYTMLEGAPPFAGSVHRIMAGHMTEEAADLPSNRTDVPPSLTAVIQRCLVKDPRKRFQTGQELIDALDAGLEPTLLTRSLSVSRRTLRRRPRLALLGLVGLVTAGYFTLQGVISPSPSVELDPGRIAVFPFGVTGAGADANLGTALAELLAQRLPGDHGPRALSPAETAAALDGGPGPSGLTDGDGSTAARALGTAEFIVGQITVVGTEISIASRVRSTSGSGPEHPTVTLRGEADQLGALADELSTRLLASRAGVRAYRLPTLLRADPLAVRAYLAGRQLLDGGAYRAAANSFNDALDADTTFALAGIEILSLNLLSEGARDFAFRAFRLAPHARETLDPRDQRLLTALLGPDYPATPSVQDQREAWETVIGDRPDEAEPWIHQGVLLQGSGELIGIRSALGDAKAAFLRASELDPSSPWPWMYLLDIAAAEGDAAGAARYWRRLTELEARVDPEVEMYYRWRAALAVADTVVLDSLGTRLSTTPYPALRQLVGSAQIDGLGLPYADTAAVALRATAAREIEVAEANELLRARALNGGRPEEAATIPWDPVYSSWNEFHQVMYGLYWGADPAVADEAGRWARGQDPLAQPDGAVNHQTACALGLWELHRGDREILPELVEKLRTIPNDGRLIGGANAEACAAILEAEAAVRDRRTDARAKVEYLDALVRPGPNMYGSVLHLSNLVAARLFAELGDPERGLAAARRRNRNAVRGVQFLAPMILLEARLAEEVGDVDGALRAYRHFLALHADAEPALQPGVDEIRAAVGRLADGA